MPGAQQIPWGEYLQTYNRMYKTNLKTPQEMIKYLYDREGTLLKVARQIGVSDNTINLFMQKHGLPRLPRGHRGNSTFQVAYRAIENPGQYTHRELAEIVGCSLGYVSILKKREEKHGRKSETISKRSSNLRACSTN